MADFRRYTKEIENPFPKKKVASIDFEIVMENASGTLWATDFMFQDGEFMTGWVHNSKEMLQPMPTDPPRYYNAIVRGQKALYLRNDGDTMGYANWTITADTDMAPPKSTTDYNGVYSIEFGMFYRTRNIRIEGSVRKDDVFKFWGNPMTVSKNNTHFNRYAGFFLGSPAGDNYYMVSLPGEQPAKDSYSKERIVAPEDTSKRVRVLIAIKPQDLAEGGSNL